MMNTIFFNQIYLSQTVAILYYLEQVFIVFNKMGLTPNTEASTSTLL